jgi:signal transduction histidine kinase
LAIVGDLCRAYGGTIKVGDGNPGAIFSVQFPVAPRTPDRGHGAIAVDGLLEPAHR